MHLILFALRRPITVVIALIAIGLSCLLAVRQMPVDIFPSLNLPVIYVCQPYGGMDPAQMEGFLANYYEYHFLYITGIDHVESRNVQGLSLMKLQFHPGTDMSQAMAETINYVNRARAFMPVGTVSPFVMRFDTGSVPVGYLVFKSETRSIGEIQDLALFQVRPKFANLPGVSAPPPFGGNARTVVVSVDPERLRAYGMSPEEVVRAVGQSNTISPSGNIPIGDKYPIVPVNSVVRNIAELESIPLRMQGGSTVYLRDVGRVQDSTDAPTGYGLVNGRRSVYMLVTKRANASTLSVVNAVKAALPEMQKALPPDVRVSYEFDQSPYVTQAVRGVILEGAVGAFLVGLMILLFLRDWRSALIVLLNIPLALMTSVVALWLCGQTINLMTLGGLALAIGILVDEATVAIENIHSHLERGQPLTRAVLDGSRETSLPRLLAMVAILAVFISAFFMEGAPRAMFVPLSLAVGFSMAASYVLSSTFVPVASVWLLRHARHSLLPKAGMEPTCRPVSSMEKLRRAHEQILRQAVRFRIAIVLAYLIASAAIILGIGSRLGTEIFPATDAGKFRLRLRAAEGTHIGRSEQIALQTLDLIKQTVGADNVELTLGYVGTIPAAYPINAVYQFSRGPEEAILWVALKKDSGIRLEKLEEELRAKFADQLPDVRVSFEPADIVNEVMSFGSPTPVDVAVSGPNFAETRAFASKMQVELAKIPSLRDLQITQSLDYPTIQVNVDREKAGLAGVSPTDLSRAIGPATSSSRFVVPNFWADPKTGIGYQVQVEIPRPVVRPLGDVAGVGSIGDIESLPVKQNGASQVLVRDVASVTAGTMPGEYDRYNMRRQIGLTANVVGEDLGTVSRRIDQSLKRSGTPPVGAKVEVRGQIPPMREMLSGLGLGLGLAVVFIFLLLAANFQSLRLALTTVSTAPAVVAGVALTLFATHTTLNIQSLIGSIMAIGVAMANAILLVTFAENRRRQGESAPVAAVAGASGRFRAILMTSCAMMAGMFPLALGLGESGQQNAPLGRAVLGGLAAATLATLFVLPSVFALIQNRASARSSSLDPDDPESVYYAPSGGAPAVDLGGSKK